jgi:hypothetical protein
MNEIHGDVNSWRWPKAAIQDTSKAFSSEVETGSRQENASK